MYYIKIPDLTNADSADVQIQLLDRQHLQIYQILPSDQLSESVSAHRKTHIIHHFSLS
jgi:hypothetical protein